MKTLPISLMVLIGSIEDGKAELWLQKREEDGPLDGTWEFPGGKMEAGESSVRTAKRELLEEVGIEVDLEKISSFKTYTHDYVDRSVCLFVHLLYFSPDSKYLKELNRDGWKKLHLVEDGSNFFERQESWVAEIPEANREILMDLATYLNRNHNEKNWRRHWQQLSC